SAQDEKFLPPYRRRLGRVGGFSDDRPQNLVGRGQNRQKLSLRLLYGPTARKTLQNPLAGSLLAHRQRPHPRLVPSTGRPTPDAPQRQRGQYPRVSWPVEQPLAAAGARRSPELLGQCTGRSALIDVRQLRHPATL